MTFNDIACSSCLLRCWLLRGVEEVVRMEQSEVEVIVLVVVLLVLLFVVGVR